jgi:predicted ATPase
LRDRRLLLVLDNCEHLVEACAQLADALLRGCPGMTILATSREPLRIAGETAWPVPPLSVPARSETPSLDTLFACDAIQLFVERARSAGPAFALNDRNASAVADICARLDGIPLAIELAAARVRLLSPDQIAARLSDRFRLLTGGARTALPRHQTIRALVD